MAGLGGIQPRYYAEKEVSGDGQPLTGLRFPGSMGDLDSPWDAL